ncbi:MAG: HD domain-containing protein [Ignavibacteriaceae bacterium]|nr:HD domain-containing protein [Ignavibacteriaceae bacterium]
MLLQTELISLNKGDAVSHYLLLKKCEVRLTKAGKEYITIELGDRSCSLGSNIWDNFEVFYNSAKTGDVVKVTGTIDEYQGNLQIKISHIRVTKESDGVSPVDFQVHSKRNPDVMKKEFFDRLEIISTPALKLLMQNIFNEDNFALYSTAPAGKQWHHAYIHGLLEHTLEIIKICDLMSDIHPEINRDMLICGAMMHDFGKVEELNFNGAFEYSDKGKLLGHIVISAMKVKDEAEKISGFSEELKNCLIHLVLSHQGKLEFASPVVPKTLEAITLYQADELSAKGNAYKNALATEIRGDAKWTKYIGLASTDLYNHGIEPDQEKIINKSLFD